MLLCSIHIMHSQVYRISARMIMPPRLNLGGDTSLLVGGRGRYNTRPCPPPVAFNRPGTATIVTTIPQPFWPLRDLGMIQWLVPELSNPRSHIYQVYIGTRAKHSPNRADVRFDSFLGVPRRARAGVGPAERAGPTRRVRSTR